MRRPIRKHKWPKPNLLARRIGTAITGVGSRQHVYEAVTDAGVQAALVSSIVHYSTHSIAKIKGYLAERGVSVRTL